MSVSIKNVNCYNRNWDRSRVKQEHRQGQEKGLEQEQDMMRGRGRERGRGRSMA